MSPVLEIQMHKGLRIMMNSLRTFVDRISLQVQDVGWKYVDQRTYRTLLLPYSLRETFYEAFY